MTSRGRLTIKKIFKLAEINKINIAKLKKEMRSPEVDIELQSNLDLASKLNINGTPAFIIGDKIIPYAISFEELKKLVNKESNS